MVRLKTTQAPQALPSHGGVAALDITRRRVTLDQEVGMFTSMESQVMSAFNWCEKTACQCFSPKKSYKYPIRLSLILCSIFGKFTAFASYSSHTLVVNLPSTTVSLVAKRRYFLKKLVFSKINTTTLNPETIRGYLATLTSSLSEVREDTRKEGSWRCKCDDTYCVSVFVTWIQQEMSCDSAPSSENHQT